MDPFTLNSNKRVSKQIIWPFFLSFCLVIHSFLFAYDQWDKFPNTKLTSLNWHWQFMLVYTPMGYTSFPR